MPDHELLRLQAREKLALAQYGRVVKSFARAPEVVEAARSIWAEANTAVVKYQEETGA